MLAVTAYLAYGISHDGLLPTLGRSMYLALLSLTSLYLYGFIYLTKSSFLSFIHAGSSFIVLLWLNVGILLLRFYLSAGSCYR